MPQINSGKVPPWVEGEIVTAGELNAMITAATLNPSAVSAQTDITTLTGDEYALIYDPVSTGLRKTQLKNINESGVDIVTDNINGKTEDGTLLVQATGTDGHLALRGGGAGYSGEVSIFGEDVNINSVGTTNLGAFTLTAGDGGMSFTSSGAITFNDPVTISDIDGVTNFADGFQIAGSPAYVFLGVVEETIPIDATNVGTGWTTKWTSASYTKPAGEVWIVETNANYSYNNAWFVAGRMLLNSSTTTLDGFFQFEGGGTSYNHHDKLNYKYVFDSASTFTSTFKLDFMASSASCPHILGVLTFQTPPFFSGVSLPASKFRITKFKAS